MTSRVTSFINKTKKNNIIIYEKYEEKTRKQTITKTIENKTYNEQIYTTENKNMLKRQQKHNKYIKYTIKNKKIDENKN